MVLISLQQDLVLRLHRALAVPALANCGRFQNFPISIGIEREATQSGYVSGVAGKRGAATSLPDAAKAAANEAFAWQASMAHRDELSTLRHDNKQLREELGVLLALGILARRKRNAGAPT